MFNLGILLMSQQTTSQEGILFIERAAAKGNMRAKEYILMQEMQQESASAGYEPTSAINTTAVAVAVGMNTLERL